jgi:hypothetical protein
MSDEQREAVIIRGKGGRFLPGTTSPAPITHANAHEFAQKGNQVRWNRARQAAQSRILAEAAAADPTVTHWSDAWGVVVAKQYAALVEEDKVRGDDLHRIGQAMGALPLAGELQAQQAQSQGNSISIGEADAVLVVLMRSSVGITNISTNDEQYIDADNVQEISTDADGGQTGGEGG